MPKARNVPQSDVPVSAPKKGRPLTMSPDYGPVIDALRADLEELRSQVEESIHRSGDPTPDLDQPSDNEVPEFNELSLVSESSEPVLSTEELDALDKATAALGSLTAESVDQESVEAPKDAEPAAQQLTDDEIRAMFIASIEEPQELAETPDIIEPTLAAMPEPEPLPEAPEGQSPVESAIPAVKEPEKADVAEGVLSESEIRAMLGLVTPEDEAQAGSVSAEVPESTSGVGEPESEPTADSGADAADAVMSPAQTFEATGPDWECAPKGSPQAFIAALCVPVGATDSDLHCWSVEPFDRPALDTLGGELGLTIVPMASSVDVVVGELRHRFGQLDDEPVVRSEGASEPTWLAKMSQNMRRSA